MRSFPVSRRTTTPARRNMTNGGSVAGATIGVPGEAYAYDTVVLGFWLSHVPLDRMGRFLSMLRRCMAPGGQLFLVDSCRDPLGTTPDQPLPDADQPWLARRLNDGREFRVAK